MFWIQAVRLPTGSAVPQPKLTAPGAIGNMDKKSGIEACASNGQEYEFAIRYMG